MPLLEPVIWSKGTFLTPQYLQAQDRYLEDSLQFQMQALKFRRLGFRSLRLDQQALASGTLALSEASGILPTDYSSISPRRTPHRRHGPSPSSSNPIRKR